jgi:hypothetical protein
MKNNQLEDLYDDIPDENVDLLSKGMTEDIGEIPEDSSFLEELLGMQDEDEYAEQAENPTFNANLAEYIDEATLREIASDQIGKVDDDIKSRSQYIEYIREVATEMGIMDSTDNMMEKFPGELSLSYPLYMKAIIQFSSRVVPEIFPAKPIKSQVLGNPDPMREDQAHRVEEVMNYQYTLGDPENKRDFRKMIWWLPAAGSMFRRPYHDSLQNKIKVRTVKAEDIIVEYSTTSLSSAYRYTYQLYENRNDTLKLMKNGYYRDCKIDLGDGYDEDSEDSLQDVRDASDGMTNSSTNDLNIYHRYYVYTYLDLPGFEDKDENGEPTGIELPYEICIDVNSRNILAIYRDWKETDSYRIRRNRFAHYKYQEGFGFYGSSIYHIIGTIQRTINGAIRAFNGALAFSLAPSGFKTKDAKISGDQILKAGHFIDVDATGLDIDKAIKILTFAPPSPMVLEYVNMLDSQAQNLISAQDIMAGDMNAVNAPVGSTMAILEQANKTITSQHQSIRESFDDEIKIVYDLNYDFLPDEDKFLAPGKEGIIRRSDFDDRVLVMPTSDPTKASFQMKLAADQAALQIFQMKPDIFRDGGAILFRRILEDMEVPGIDEVAYSRQEIQKMIQMQQQTPPPPTPEQIMVQIAQEEMQLKSQLDQMRQQVDLMKIDLENRKLEVTSVLKNKELDQKVGVFTQNNMLTEEYISQIVHRLVQEQLNKNMQQQQIVQIPGMNPQPMPPEQHQQNQDAMTQSLIQQMLQGQPQMPQQP